MATYFLNMHFTVEALAESQKPLQRDSRNFGSLVDFAERLTKNYVVLLQNSLQTSCNFVGGISPELTLIFFCKSCTKIEAPLSKYFPKKLLKKKKSKQLLS